MTATPVLGGVTARGFDVLRGGIDAGDGGTEFCKRFGNESAAAADIEDGECAERAQRLCVTAEVADHFGAQIAEPRGADLVQRAELAMFVPPLGGDAGELVDLAGVEGCRVFACG